jgi:hypothetical protein
MCNTRGTEPSLDELFGDVVMQLLMRRDGVTESDVRALLSELWDVRAVASAGPRAKVALCYPQTGGATKKKINGSRSSEASTFPLRFI